MSQDSDKKKSRSRFHFLSPAKEAPSLGDGPDTTTATKPPTSTLKGVRSFFRSLSPAPMTDTAPTSPSPSGVHGPAQPQSSGDAPVIEPAEPPPDHKNFGRVGWNFTKTLMARVGEFLEPNPIKLAFGIVNMIVEMSGAVKDNMDTVERRIYAIAVQLNAVERALEGWTSNGINDKRAIERFQQVLAQEFARLKQLSEEWLLTKIADHEDEKGEIAGIFERAQEARLQLGVETDLRILKMAHAIDRHVRDTLLDHLKPSDMADHTYELEGSQRDKLRRVVCTHGTRSALLDEIITWAKDGSELVYWLSGPAGSGKSTVAYTLARRFELAGSEDPVVLGANFFCSRHYEETRFATRIIRTVAYQLALRFEPFADALADVGEFGSATKGVQTQLQDLLITPWQQVVNSRSTTNPGAEPPHHLIIIDALDELDSTGGAEFLRHVLPALAKHTLHGLKFLVTSRPDPELAQQLTRFEARKAFRLQDIAPEDARSDVEIYLQENLPQLVGTPQLKQLVALTDGLFIFASTIMYHLLPRQQAEQLQALDRLFALKKSSQPDPRVPSSRQATRFLDQLYDQLLKEALKEFEDSPEYLYRLRIIHTFLCANEPVSPATTAGLVFEDEYPDPPISSTPTVDNVVRRLHAVLYIQNGKVFSYHKSFPDFIFDKSRSGEFACNAPMHHQSLAQSCVRVLNVGLRFNIADIPSSAFVDSDNATLRDRVEQNIPPILRYACHQWTYHLSSFPSLPPPSPDQLGPLHNGLQAFITLPALFWIEAMNLLGSGGLCDSMFQQAFDVATSHKIPWAPHFLEAASFATYFVGSPASVSTPHLYISALATWPRQLSPIIEWKSHFPTIPRFTNPSNRCICLSTLRPSDSNAPVQSIQLLPCGHGFRIICGTNDNLARVMDPSTGLVLLTLEGHDRAVSSVAYSKDHHQIATGSWDKTVRLWDAATGRLISTLVGHSKGVHVVTFSPDGTRLVSGDADATAIVWDAVAGSKEFLLIGHTSAIMGVVYSPDASWIGTGSIDGTVRVWDSKNGGLLKVLKSTHDLPCHCLTVTPDGRQVVAGMEDGTIVAWESTTGNLLVQAQVSASVIRSMATIPNTQKVALATADSSIYIWDIGAGGVVARLNGHTSGVSTVAVSSDGRRLVSGSKDGTIRIWDGSVVDQGLARESCSWRLTDAVFSCDGSQIVSSSEDGTIHVHNSGTGELLKTFDECHQREIFRTVSVSRDGTRILAGARSGSVHIWDTEACKKVGELKAHSDMVYTIAISDDNTIITSASRDLTVKAWDATTFELLRTFPTYQDQNDWNADVSFGAWTNGVWKVHFDEDMGGLGVCNVTAAISTPRSRLNFEEGIHSPKDVYRMTVSRNGEWIVTAIFHDFLVLWNGTTGNSVCEMHNQSGLVWGMDISNNGALLVVAGDESMTVWDVATGSVRCVMEGHTMQVRRVRLSDKADRAVSVGDDGTIRVWDLGATKEKELALYTPEVTGDGTGTGWLLSSDGGGGRLMFVPRDARLHHRANILTIPATAMSSVDFSQATTGDQWVNCYVPQL